MHRCTNIHTDIWMSPHVFLRMYSWTCRCTNVLTDLWTGVQIDIQMHRHIADIPDI